MPRSHPPTLLTLVSRALREECGVSRGSRVLLALSGGGDSTALLHALSLLRKKQGFFLVAHGVNHGLRPEARAELDQAEALCAALGVAFSRTDLSVASGGNLQARARDARRAALGAAAQRAEAELIATAHHADDRAETVLIRLLRGAGPRGLAVLPPRTGVWIRPLCRVRKSDIVLHLARHGLAFSEDPSNHSLRFLRTRVRHELLPLLEQLSPRVAEHLCALADALAEAPERAPVLLDECGIALPLNRAQRVQIERAHALGQRLARVTLAGGRELSFDPATLEPRLVAARPRSARKR